jgi:hypothetical protein
VEVVDTGITPKSSGVLPRSGLDVGLVDQ